MGEKPITIAPIKQYFTRFVKPFFLLQSTFIGFFFVIVDIENRYRTIFLKRLAKGLYGKRVPLFFQHKVTSIVDVTTVIWSGVSVEGNFIFAPIHSKVTLHSPRLKSP